MLRNLAIVAGAGLAIALICFSVAAVLTGPGLMQYAFASGEETSPDATGQTRPLSGFTSISASGGSNVHVTVGADYRVEVIGPRPQDVLTEVRGSRLIIAPRRQDWRRPRAHHVVRVSMPSLEALSSSSGAAITASGVGADDFIVDASSGAVIDVRGACATLEVEVSSGASVNAGALRCDSGRVAASSGASARIDVSGVLDVTASSGGHVDAAGAPRTRHVSLSSGGTLRTQAAPAPAGQP